MRKLRNTKLVVILALFYVIAGCTTAQYGNENIADSAYINKIEKGLTTKTEIEKLFGRGKIQIRKGKEMWVYTYIKEEIKVLSSYDNKQEYWQLQCFFNQQDILEDFNYYNEIR